MSDVKNGLESCTCKIIVNRWLGKGKKEQDTSEVITSEIMVTKDFTK